MTNIHRPKNTLELKNLILLKTPSFYFSSKTSTVVPYDHLNEYLKSYEKFNLVDLSLIEGDIILNDDQTVTISGNISWKDLKIFLRSKNLEVMTSPTEELASVLAGLATSCTGERCFSFGNMREQIIDITYLDINGEEKYLKANQLLNLDFNIEEYQNDFIYYQNFKNAPYPRLKYETDLMIGMEGQLGIITKATIKTTVKRNLLHLFLSIDPWETNLDPHLEIFHKIQNFRKEVLLCELIDSNSINYLDKEDRPCENKDIVFFEVYEDKFEYFYENFINKLELINEENIFEISENKFHHLRANIPRKIFEVNSMMKVKKMGTDTQVKPEQFKELLEYYQKLAQNQEKIKYNLFGHFGDAHLHFNFMPTSEQISTCKNYFLNFYQEVKNLRGSPFAEHGIGLLKQEYVKPFYNNNQFNTFKNLKEKFDPQNLFFPMGFLSIKK